MDTAAAILILLSVGLGIWLSLRGRPLNMPLSVLHKLSAVAALVFTALAVFGGAGFTTLALMKQVAGVVALVALVALFATGAVLSGKERKKVLMWVHGVGTAVALFGICFEL